MNIIIRILLSNLENTGCHSHFDPTCSPEAQPYSEVSLDQRVATGDSEGPWSPTEGLTVLKHPVTTKASLWRSR